MDIQELAEQLNTDAKLIRRFLRLPEWQIVDINRIDTSSVTVIEQAFNKWHKPCPTIEQTEKITQNEEEIIIVPAAKIAWEVAARQNAWLERRLQEEGLAIGKKRNSSKWRNADKYDTSRVGTNDEDEML